MVSRRCAFSAHCSGGQVWFRSNPWTFASHRKGRAAHHKEYPEEFAAVRQTKIAAMILAGAIAGNATARWILRRSELTQPRAAVSRHSPPGMPLAPRQPVSVKCEPWHFQSFLMKAIGQPQIGAQIVLESDRST